jgi:regulatory protein YycI of two-component signal transduction system YycFG
MNSVAIDVGTKSSFSEDDQPFYLSFRMNKCIFIIIGLLLLLVLAITMTFLITRFNKKDCTLNSLRKHEQLELTNQELTKQLSEKDEEINRFTKEQGKNKILQDFIF